MKIDWAVGQEVSLKDSDYSGLIRHLYVDEGEIYAVVILSLEFRQYTKDNKCFISQIVVHTDNLKPRF